MAINKYESTKSYTAMLLSMFDNIVIDKQGASYTVPIYFTDREKLVMMVDNTSASIDTVVPTMSLQFNSLDLEPTRQTNHLLRKSRIQIDGVTYDVQWNDSMVNYNFTLNILTRTMNDMTAILEFIISKFKNSLYYMNYKSPIFEDYISTPIVMESNSVEMVSDESFDGRSRMVQASIEFTVKGVVHNNITSTQAKVETIELFLQTYDQEVANTVQQHVLEVDSDGRVV